MATGNIEINHRVGRLIETRVRAIIDLEDVLQLRQRLLAILATSSESFLSAIDVRAGINLGRNQIAQVLLQTFRDSSDGIERTGILVGADALMPVQVEAMILRAGHPGRKVFREVEPFLEYLGELATPEERARLAEFIAELTAA